MLFARHNEYSVNLKVAGGEVYKVYAAIYSIFTNDANRERAVYLASSQAQV